MLITYCRSDNQAAPELEQFISEKLKGVSGEKDIPNQSLLQDDHALLLVCQDPVEEMEQGEYQDVSDDDDEDEGRFVGEALQQALKAYGEKVAAMLLANPEDKSTLKAAKAMTRTLVKAQKSIPHTLQQQMHGFGAGGAASRRTKTGRIIKPNPPAISARQAPGSMPAPLGRRFRDRSGEVAMEAGSSRVVLADHPPVYRDRVPHNLALAVEKNVPNAK